MKNKNFEDDEIIGYVEVDGKRAIYLKPGVTRLNYNTHIPNDDYYEQMDQNLINLERWTKFYKDVMGYEDFESEDN